MYAEALAVLPKEKVTKKKWYKENNTTKVHQWSELKCGG